MALGLPKREAQALGSNGPAATDADSDGDHAPHDHHGARHRRDDTLAIGFRRPPAPDVSDETSWLTP